MNGRQALAIAALLWSAAASPAEPDARVALPDFSSIADQASATVDITLGPSLLSMASRFLDAKNPQEASAREIINGLKGIYVKSYSFDAPFSYPKAGIDAIRKQLAAPGWSRLVGVHSRKDGTDVDIYLLTENNRAAGLTLIATEPRQFTIVNIVGSIDLEKLHKIEGQFGVPKLPLESASGRTE